LRLKATDIYDYYRPNECERRVALRARKEPEQETDSPFDDLLRNLGHRHEAAHLATLPAVVDLNPDAHDQPTRERLTLESIRANAPAIYQPRFRLEFPLDGEPCELIGEPDFLIRDPARRGYVIRDSKLARNIGSRRHLAIPLQLKIYAFLFERLVGKPALGLEVHAGTGEIVPVTYEAEAEVLDALRNHRRMRAVDPAGYEPVGVSKCDGCGYEDRCWNEAEAARDVALLPTASQKRARELHARGITSIGQISAAVDDPAHHDYFWTGKKPIRKRFVSALLKSAESHDTNTAILTDDPQPLPIARNYAMFDLEGLPPYADDLDRTYLWGVKVFGETPSPYLPAQSGFGPDGDREGWFAFLDLAARLFTQYGPDLPFIHWSSHEKTRVTEYVRRYGDVPLPTPSDPGRAVGAGLAPARVGIAAQVLSNLTDLYALTKASIVLPLPSYSLKVVDQYVGYRRTLADANGIWSIAEYIKATETNDPAKRAEIVNQILAYNEEDLDATWAVMEWLRRQFT
jgi:predicted RecB family nuclease